MSKSAIQQAIDNLQSKLDGYDKATDKYIERCVVYDCIQIVKKLKEVEKQNFIHFLECYEPGLKQGDSSELIVNSYYKENFND